MRVCFIYDRRYGGLPKATLQVASYLSKHGDTVLALGPMHYHENWRKAAINSGVEVLESHSHLVLSHSQATKSAITAFAPDIVVSAHRGCDVRTSRFCQTLKLPHVIAMHGNPTSTVDVQNSNIPALLLRNLLWKRSITRSRLVICCSAWVADGLRTGFKVQREKICVIYNGIPLEKFHVARAKEPPSEATRRRVLAVGRLSKEKNPCMFVDLIAESLEHEIELDGTWLGDGPLLDEMKRYARERGVSHLTHFPGNVDEPEAFYQKSHIFAHFRLDEAFGLVLAEAQAAGLPIVAFRAGAIPEVAEDGIVALLTDEADLSGMIQNLKRLLCDPHLYSRISTNGVRCARSRFSAERAGDRYRNALGSLLRI